MAKTDNFWKCVLGACIGLGSAVGGAFGYHYVTDYLNSPKPKVVHQVSYRDKSMNDVRIDKLVELDVKDKRVDILDNRVPCETLKVVPGKYSVFNQAGGKEGITDLIERSKSDSDAQYHIEDLLQVLHGNYATKSQMLQDLTSPKDLAMEAITLAWYENTMNLQHNLDYELRGDSTQTWKELNTRTDKLGKKLGDCEDFTLELITEYELMRQMAEERKDTDPFYSKLFNGFMQTQLVGISYYGKSSMYGKDSGHEMIAMLAYNPDFKKVDITLLEPQVYQMYGDNVRYSLGLADGQLIIWNTKDPKYVKINKINYVYTGKGVCVPKETK
ncbi:MAG: hypothetical protein V1906_02235 [Candidatus Woesearchaeota archaeon]